MNGKVKILICAASPKNASATQAGPQFEAIKKIFANTNFEVLENLATQLEDLLKALAQHEPHIVHFIGHGQETGLILEDQTGKKENASTEQLVEIFKNHSQDVGQPIELLFLNACRSYSIVRQLAMEIKCDGIGMSKDIESNVAQAFARNFYEFLKTDNDYQKAFRFAKKMTFGKKNACLKEIPKFIDICVI